MSAVEEQLSQQFFDWEKRGRGWHVYDTPVFPEPPFRPFIGHYFPQESAIDDGRRPTFLSNLVETISRNLSTEPEALSKTPEPDQEPEPLPLIRSSLVELRIALPSGLDVRRECFEDVLASISFSEEPLAFELVGLSGRIWAQFVASAKDAPNLRRHLQARFPEATFQESEAVLESAWHSSEAADALVVEFGLARELMLSLATCKSDPFIGIVAALAELSTNELAVFQVLFQAVHAPWQESIIRSVTDVHGAAFFLNMPELPGAAKEKTSRPLYATVVRIAVRAEGEERSLQIARDLAGALRIFAHPNGNELIPLSNENYPYEDHLDDVVSRQSRRPGMILNSEELVGFVHLPSSTIRSPAFLRNIEKTKLPPSIVRQPNGLIIGNNIHAGNSIPVALTPEQRVRHIHIVGASGTGKSTLLYNLIRQDIENGQGIAVLDPHGDLVDRILNAIPQNRVSDVVLVDPSDEEFSVGFNILSAHSALEKNLLASDLVSVFQRLSTTWGDQMGSVLSNAILAFLESSRGGTLADLRRFLIEPGFRNQFLESVNDPDLLYYWHKGFPQLSGNRSIGPVLTRLETFLTPKPIRYMVSQPENRLDFAEIMDTGKIFLAKLSQGLLGKENSYLLGTLLVSKFHQLAMARQAQETKVRRDFSIYLDEFHNFITPTMAEILSGSRKYRIGLVLAHQELRQLQRDYDVASAVMSNCHTRIVFRVSDDDAKRLADGFSFFEACDIQNLEIGKALARVERSDFDFNLSVQLPEPPNDPQSITHRSAIINASRSKYAVPRAEVEAARRRSWETEQAPQKQGKTQNRPSIQQQKVEPASGTVQSPPAQETSTPLASQPEKAPITPPAPPSPIAPPPPAAPGLTEPIPAPETKKPGRVADLGRGGAQHQAIQQRIKVRAEELGFRGTIEKQILEGQGSVDLLLERSDTTIACEISVSTTIDHEVGNVARCFRAGFPIVAIICIEKARLRKISAAVSSSLGAELAAKAVYFEPDEFVAYLTHLPVPAPKPDEPVMRRGYKVKRSSPKLTPEELKQKQEAAIRSIAETMRSSIKPKKKK